VPQSDKPETVLITGATGFIGRRLIERLAAQATVIAASRSGADIHGGRGVRLDLEDPGTLSNLPERVDTVVHMAALIDSADLHASLRINVAGTLHLLEYARAAGARTFVHGSTGGVYGSSSGVLHEDSPLKPQDPYGLSKAQAEQVVSWFPADFTKVILRYCAPYGLGTPNPITRIIASVLAGAWINVTDSMSPRFNPLHISDAIEMTVRAMRLDADHVLNISGTEVTTQAAIALIAARHLGLTAQLRRIDLSDVMPYHRDDSVMDGQAAWGLLGYTPTVSLTNGVAEMADAMRNAQEAQ
jgi:nucleoside-diphosphate-sugar epimerase